MRNQPLDKVSGQIQNFLANQSRQLAMKRLLASIKAKHDVQINLDPRFLGDVSKPKRETSPRKR